jgi:hypothetical protein
MTPISTILLQRWWILLISLTITVAIILLLPSVLALHDQSCGAQLLDEVLTSIGGADDVSTYCFPPELIEDDQSKLESAQAYLAQSLRHKDLSHTHLLLGRVACLLGNTENAVESYVAFTEARPDNPLGHVELALGYFLLNKGYVQKTRLTQEIITETLKANVNPLDMFSNGQVRFHFANYENADLWFEIGSLTNITIPKSLLFLWNISSIVSKGRFIENLDQLNFPPQIINNETKIEAKSLIWVVPNLVTGETLETYPSGNPDSGVMWWNGIAIVPVDVQTSATYKIILRAQNVPPLPIRIQLEHNFSTIAQFETDKDDYSWSDFSVLYKLEKGLHIIGVQFLNDGIENGINRNAVLDWIRIESVKK